MVVSGRVGSRNVGSWEWVVVTRGAVRKVMCWYGGVAEACLAAKRGSLEGSVAGMMGVGKRGRQERLLSGRRCVGKGCWTNGERQEGAVSERWL